MDPTSRGVTALAQLPLVSYLSASPSPSLVLALSPLVDYLVAQPQATLARPPPVQTPLWDGKAAQLSTPPPASKPRLPVLNRRDAAGSDAPDADQAMSPAEDIRGLVEQLNVQTPLSGPGPQSSRQAFADYFSLTSTAPAPTSADGAFDEASSELAEQASPAALSSTSSASSAATIMSFASAGTAGAAAASESLGKATPPTPVDDVDTFASHLVGGSKGLDFAAPNDVEERLADALRPVYRNEAWRSIEARRAVRPGPGTRETSNSTLKAYRPALYRAQSSSSREKRGRKSLNRRGSATEEDLLIDSLPAAPGFETKPKGLGTVEEEELEPDDDRPGDLSMETDDDDRFPSASASENPDGDLDAEVQALRFLSAEEQQQLLVFLLELVVDMDVLGETGTVTPDIRSPDASPRVGGSGYGSPRSSLRQLHGNEQGSRRGSAASKGGPPRPVQHCKIGDTDFTATIIVAPVPATPQSDLRAVERSLPTGWVILTTPIPPVPAPTPREPGLPQAWPRGTGIGVPTRPAAPASGSSSSLTAVPLAPAGSLAHSYQSPTAETIRTAGPASHPSVREGDLTPSGESSLDADAKWMASLGDGEMAQRIRAHDWSRTTLGPISSWCPELRTVVASILASPFRECILWGEDMTIVYNDLYIGTAGNKHPGLLGLPASEGWKEIWDGLNSVAQKTLAGETCFFKDHFLAMERLGFVEETCKPDHPRLEAGDLR